MQKRRRYIPPMLMAAAIVGIVLFLLKGEEYLRIDSDAVEGRTDAVVVLAGSYKEDRERIEEGTMMVRNGKGKYLILPLRHPAIDWPWVVEYFSLKEDLPDNRVLIGRSTPEDEPMIDKFGGTYVEARKTVGIMQRLGLKTAIVVSSAYHMRRAQMAFTKNQSAARMTFYYHPVEHNPIENRTWWLDLKYLGKILQEYKKVLAAFFVYNSSNDPAP